MIFLHLELFLWVSTPSESLPNGQFTFWRTWISVLLFICFFIKIQRSSYKNVVFGNVFHCVMLICCCFALFFLFSSDIWCRTKVPRAGRRRCTSPRAAGTASSRMQWFSRSKKGKSMSWDKKLHDMNKLIRIKMQNNKTMSFSEKNRQFAESVRAHRTHPDLSECIQAHPNRSKQVRTSPKTSKNLRKPRKSQKIRENRLLFILILIFFVLATTRSGDFWF